ncbi:MAG TPA: hypothetical protein VL463_01915 [Kofleriaceae bacterium]|nr:hypothetical protein [Kofleriaceae bacterium]
MRRWLALAVLVGCHNEPGDLTVSSAYTGPCAVHAWVDDLYTTGDGFDLAPGDSRSFPGLVPGLHETDFRVTGNDACGHMCELFAAGGFESGCQTYVAGGFPGAVSVVDEGACKVPRLSCATQETAADFDLAVAEDALAIARGRTADLHVTIDRRGATGAITVSASGLPAGTGASPITIPAGASTGTITVVAGAQAVQTTATVTISGSPAGAMSHPTDTVTITFTGASGDLDTSFASDGTLTLAVGSTDAELRDAVLVPGDGFVGVGVAGGKWLAVKIGADGVPDPAFGTAGVAALAPTGIATRVARQADGKLVIVGAAGADFTIARIDGTTGALDPGFGTGGIATIDASGEGDTAEALALVGGRIVVGGTAGTTDPDFALIGLTSAGALDPNFGIAGKTRTIVAGEDHLDAIAIDANDRIYVAGYHQLANGTKQMSVRRYSTTGTLDAGYTGTGSTSIENGIVGDLALVGAGAAQYPISNGGFHVEQLDPSGALDASFGGTGNVDLFVGASYANGIASVPEGTVIAGSVFTSASMDFYVARVTPAGAIDPSFGTAGAVTTAFDVQNPDIAEDVLVDSKGRYVLVGWAQLGFGAPHSIAAARYIP